MMPKIELKAIRELHIADGKYTLVFDPLRNDKLVAVKRYGEDWIDEGELGVQPNWFIAAIYKLKELAEEKING